MSLATLARAGISFQFNHIAVLQRARLNLHRKQKLQITKVLFSFAFSKFRNITLRLWIPFNNESRHLCSSCYSRLCSKSSPTNPARAEEYISLLQIHGWHRSAPARNDGSLAYLANSSKKRGARVHHAHRGSGKTDFPGRGKAARRQASENFRCTARYPTRCPVSCSSAQGY